MNRGARKGAPCPGSSVSLASGAHRMTSKYRSLRLSSRRSGTPPDRWRSKERPRSYTGSRDTPPRRGTSSTHRREEHPAGMISRRQHRTLRGLRRKIVEADRESRTPRSDGYRKLNSSDASHKSRSLSYKESKTDRWRDSSPKMRRPTSPSGSHECYKHRHDRFSESSRRRPMTRRERSRSLDRGELSPDSRDDGWDRHGRRISPRRAETMHPDYYETEPVERQVVIPMRCPPVPVMSAAFPPPPGRLYAESTMVPVNFVPRAPRSRMRLPFPPRILRPIVRPIIEVVPPVVHRRTPALSFPPPVIPVRVPVPFYHQPHFV